MGQQTSKQKQIFRDKKLESAVTKRQLKAFCDCIKFIKQNSFYASLFIINGNISQVRKITAKIRSGDRNIIEYLIYCCTPRECASAIVVFLKTLKSPLLPFRAQQLIIGNNNGICLKTIALDVIGLLHDELGPNHMTLLASLFDLLKSLSTVGNMRPSEMRSSQAPYLLLPILFTPCDELIMKCHNIAATLNEIIMMSQLLSSKTGFVELRNQEQTILLQANRQSNGNG